MPEYGARNSSPLAVPGARGDGHDRRAQLRHRPKALVFLRRRRGRGGRSSRSPIRWLSRTATVKLHANGIVCGPSRTAPWTRHELAVGERLGGHEARPVALGIGAQATAVDARARAADDDLRELRRGHPEQADLGARGGVAAIRAPARPSRASPASDADTFSLGGTHSGARCASAASACGEGRETSPISPANARQRDKLRRAARARSGADPSILDRGRGADHGAGRVERLNRDVRARGERRDRRLKAAPGAVRDRRQRAWRGAREHPPGGDFGGPVPARRDRYRAGAVRLRDDRRRALRLRRSRATGRS